MNRGPCRVIWKQSAIEVQLARIVNYLMERGEPLGPVTDAMNALDRVLAINPGQVGESRPNFERVHSEGPLTVWFTVHDDERLVYVLRVAYAIPRRRG